jgi:hypothetical protein
LDRLSRSGGVDEFVPLHGHSNSESGLKIIVGNIFRVNLLKQFKESFQLTRQLALLFMACRSSRIPVISLFQVGPTSVA